MNPSELVERYRQAYQADAQRLHPNIALIKDRLPNFADVQDLIGSLTDNPRSLSSLPNTTGTSPLLSQSFLRASFHDLRKQGRDTEQNLDFIGRILLSHTGVDMEESAITGTWAYQNYGDCARAEGYFVDCVDQITEDQDNSCRQRRVSVYHSGREPVLLRKSGDFPTAITLKSIRLGPILVPAGSIVAVCQGMSLERTGALTTSFCNFATYRLPPVIKIAPARLSPWAYQRQEEQLLYAIKVDRNAISIDWGRANTIRSVDLDKFKAAAVKLGWMCGVQLVNEPQGHIAAR